MRLKYVLKLAGIGLFGLLLVVGCAKTNIKKTYDADVAGMPKPTTVLIYNFSINPQAVQQNSSPLSRLQRSIESEDDTAGKVKLANEVADAMAAELMKKGRYGVCERCNKDIPQARLELVPEARYCIECKKALSK